MRRNITQPDDAWDRWDAAAKKAGLGISEFIFDAVERHLGGTRKRSVTRGRPPKHSPEAVRAAVAEHGSNQLAAVALGLSERTVWEITKGKRSCG